MTIRGLAYVNGLSFAVCTSLAVVVYRGSPRLAALDILLAALNLIVFIDRITEANK